jgi:hypothetical protein
MKWLQFVVLTIQTTFSINISTTKYGFGISNHPNRTIDIHSQYQHSRYWTFNPIQCQASQMQISKRSIGEIATLSKLEQIESSRGHMKGLANTGAPPPAAIPTTNTATPRPPQILYYVTTCVPVTDQWRLSSLSSGSRSWSTSQRLNRRISQTINYPLERKESQTKELPKMVVRSDDSHDTRISLL